MIDFEEDVPLSDAQRLQHQVQDIAKGVQQALDTASKGRLLKSGLQVGTCLSTPVQRTRVWSYAVCTPCCGRQVISAVRVTTCSDRQISKHCIQQCCLQHADGVVVCCYVGGGLRYSAFTNCTSLRKNQSVKSQWHKQTTSRQGDNRIPDAQHTLSQQFHDQLQPWLASIESRSWEKPAKAHSHLQPESTAYQ